MQCYMPATGMVRIIDTLQYISKAFDFPKTITENYLQQATVDIIDIMKYPPKTLPFCPMVMQQQMQSIRLPVFFKE